MTSSLNSTDHSSNALTEDRNQAAAAVVCLATVIVGSVLVELAMRSIVVYGNGWPRYWAVAFVNGSLLPICAFAAFSARSLGWRSCLVCLGSFATLWTSLVRFRGLWMWSGTFDAYWLSPNGWLLSALVGFAAGSLPMLRRRVSKTMPVSAAYIAFVSLLGAALIEFVGGVAFYRVTESVYPETRHVFILGVATVLGIGFFLGESR